MKDARAVLKMVWLAFRYGPVKWDARRVRALLRCAWNLYRTRRKLARLEADIRRFSSDVKWF